VAQDYYSQPIESGLEIQSDWENDENDTMVHDVYSQQQQIQQSMNQSINQQQQMVYQSAQFNQRPEGQKMYGTYIWLPNNTQ